MESGTGSRFPTARLNDLFLAAGIQWAVAAGAAVYLYTGNRPPTDLDILVRPEDLDRAGRALGASPERKDAPWGVSAKVELGDVEIVGRLEIRLGGSTYSYSMDSEMVGRLRSLPFDGIRVPVLAPEEVVALKAVLQRGPDQGKHDLEDIAALADRVDMDAAYLRSRLRLMGGEERARPVLERWGWA